MLVRNDVIGIVGTRAVILEPAQDLAGKQSAGDDAIGPVGFSRDVLEDRVHIVVRELRPGAGRASNRGLAIEFDLFWIERRQVRFHLVVAERPEDFGRDLHGPGRAFREVRRIELRNQVSPFASLAVKPG